MNVVIKQCEGTEKEIIENINLGQIAYATDINKIIYCRKDGTIKYFDACNELLDAIDESNKNAINSVTNI